MPRRPQLLDARGRPIARPSRSKEESERIAAVARTLDTERELRRRCDPGDGIAGFECLALDSQFIGERMLLVYDASTFEKLKVGSTAPDTKSFGLGWKFRLIEKFTDPQRAAQWLHRLAEKI